MKARLSIVLAVLVLGGCIDLTTTVELSDSGGGTVELRYRLRDELFSLGVLDGPTDEPAVPISRRDFEVYLSPIPGARLLSHDVRSGEGETEVTAEVAFDSAETFNRIFGEGTLETSPAEVAVVLADGASSSLDSDLVEEFFAESFLRFHLTPPTRVVGLNRGSVVDGGRSAEVRIPFAEAVLSPNPVVWRLELQ